MISVMKGVRRACAIVQALLTPFMTLMCNLHSSSLITKGFKSLSPINTNPLQVNHLS